MHQLLGSLERSLSVLNAIADGVTAQNKSGQLIYVNEMAAHFSGYASAEAMLAAPISELASRFEIFDEQGNTFDFSQLPGRIALTGKQAPERILRYRNRETGEEHWSAVKAQPVFADNGDVELAVNIFRDVTLQKKQEILQQFLIEVGKTLASSLDYETTLASVAKLATPKIADWCAVDLLDEQRQIQRVAVAHIDPEKVAWAYELQKRYPPSLESDSGVAKVIKTGQTDYNPLITDELLVMAAGQDAEMLKILRELAFRSSAVVPLTARGRTLGAITLVTTADSGRYLSRDEVALAEELGRTAAFAVDNARLYYQTQSQRERFEVTLRSIGEAVIATNTEGVIELMNPVAERLTGCNQQEAVGKPMSDVFNIVSEDTSETAEDQSPKIQLQTNEINRVSYVLLNRDGRQIPIEHDTSSIADRNGELTGTVIVFRDISQRLEAERALQQYALDLMRSNEDLERFAYIASHDLQEPLRTITSYLQLLEYRYKELFDQDARDFIGFAVNAATRMKTLIDDALLYSRLTTTERKFSSFSSEEALKAALANLQAKMDETQANVIYENLPTIMGNENQFAQLFQNLISNAIKFRGERLPEIRVSAIRQQNEWLFAVQDNGIGIEAQYLDRIFIMFQRLHTREKYQGTGIGLAICRKVIEHHRGRIWAEGTPGEGTIFYFTIPADGN
jgi:PAS domain S-box-containing protein